MSTSLGVAALLLAVAVPASAQRFQRVEDLAAQDAVDRFELFTGCEPVGLVVHMQIDENDRIALTKADVTRAVRSRLRAARIYTDVPSSIYLRAHIVIVASAFNIQIEFLRWLRNGYDVGWASTWETGTTGIARSSSSYVLGALSQYMDEFIDEYLRVNAAACG